MNDFEKSCCDALTGKGYEVLRNGWPDFLVLNNSLSMGCGLELKRGRDRLSPAQRSMHLALARFGLITHVGWDDFLETLALERPMRDIDHDGVDLMIETAVRQIYFLERRLSQLRLLRLKRRCK